MFFGCTPSNLLSGQSLLQCSSDINKQTTNKQQHSKLIWATMAQRTVPLPADLHFRRTKPKNVLQTNQIFAGPSAHNTGHDHLRQPPCIASGMRRRGCQSIACCHHRDNPHSLSWPKCDAHAAEGRLWLADGTKKPGNITLYELEWRAATLDALLDKMDDKSVADDAAIFLG